MKYHGLTSAQVKQKIAEYGLNRLDLTSSFSIWKTYLNQFRSPLIFILLIISLITFALQEYSDSVVVLLVVFINSIIGTFQEARAENSLSSLRKIITHKSKTLRDGYWQVIEAEQLVPGDIVRLESGDRVPADGVLLESKQMAINESQLTGEAFAVEKNDQQNHVFMSTLVTIGRGIMKVESTGMSTQIGQISKAVKTHSMEPTVLETKLKILTSRIVVAISLVCAVVFGGGLYNRVELLEIFKTAISLGVSAIPEGLPVVVTVTLAISVFRMSRRKAILRNLPSASTLAGVDVICTDKTGTLTYGQISLVKVISVGSSTAKNVLSLSVLCNDAQVYQNSEVGDLLDIAILKKATQDGLDISAFQNLHERIDEIAFDSQLKFQATLNKFDQGNYLIVKGAPDQLASRCEFTSVQEKNDLLREFEKYAEAGYRLILVAFKPTSKSNIGIEDVKDLQPLGLLVFEDPIREDVRSSVEQCLQSGLQVVMITGDYATTAKTIAEEAGILGKNSLILDGQDVHSLSPSELNNLSVLARAKPLDKLDLVDQFQRQGKVVAMTGDGVNDTPALVKADIGIAMGKNGTDSAREASDMILTDDNFKTIVSGIEEARNSFENIRKVVSYLLSTSVGEIVAILLSLFLGLPLPLLAVQILWLNLITDGLLDIALATEKKEVGIMERDHQIYKQEIINSKLLQRMLFLGLIMGVGSLLFFGYYLQVLSLDQARTACLVVLAMFQWFNAFNTRSYDKSIMEIGFFTNKALNWSLAIEVVLLYLAVNWSVLQNLLGTVAIPSQVWLAALVVSSSIIVFEECRKYFYRQKANRV